MEEAFCARETCQRAQDALSATQLAVDSAGQTSGHAGESGGEQIQAEFEPRAGGARESSAVGIDIEPDARAPPGGSRPKPSGVEVWQVISRPKLRAT